MIPTTFEIKSANLPLVALLLKSTDLALLGRELQPRYSGFFEGEPMVVDLSPLKGEGEVDFERLRTLLDGYRVKAIAAKGGSDAQMKAAAAAGLVAAPEAGVRFAHHQPTKQPEEALVVERPLRSGQQVYAKGRDLVVLAMVNPGAEVIADGNIHVYAPLRGKAIAGARGNESARIFTLQLDPELVSIAGVYRTSDTPVPKDLHGKPAQVRLADNKLIMSSL